MLTEKKIGQKRGDRFRRLFADRTFYLFVWYEPKDAPWGFQLIYRLPKRPLCMVTFLGARPGWLHHILSEGSRSDSGHGTGSDIRGMDDRLFDRDGVLRAFAAAAGGMPRPEREFVAGRLAAHPDSFVPCRFCTAGRAAFAACCRCKTVACFQCVDSKNPALPACPRKVHDWPAH